MPYRDVGNAPGAVKALPNEELDDALDDAPQTRGTKAKSRINIDMVRKGVHHASLFIQQDARRLHNLDDVPGTLYARATG